MRTIASDLERRNQNRQMRSPYRKDIRWGRKGGPGTALTEDNTLC